MNIDAKHPNLAIDALIVAVGAVLVVFSRQFGVEVGHPLAKGLGTVFGAIYVLYLGCLFLLSYFFPDTAYVLRLLRYVCEQRSRGGKGPHMAVLYFALALGFGGWLLLFGLGVF